MNGLVSVVVPVYKTEKYLARCVESITGQTYRDLEILLVDDGSPDGSGALCDRLAEKDERIRVIHKKNGGLSDARNAGIEAAAGQYLVFCDSDDYMETGIIEKALEQMNSSGADLVVWAYSADFADPDENTVSRSVCAADETLYPGHADCLAEKDVQGLLGYAWNKLYKKSLITDGIRFEKGTALVEDVLFNAQVICLCGRVRMIGDVGTHYLHRDASTLGNKYYPDFSGLILRACGAKRQIMAHFGCSGDTIDRGIARYAMTALKVGALNIVRDRGADGSEKKQRLKEWLSDGSTVRLAETARGQTPKDKAFLVLLRLKAAGLLGKII